MKGKGEICHSNPLIYILYLLTKLTVATEKLLGKKGDTEEALKNQETIISSL